MRELGSKQKHFDSTGPWEMPINKDLMVFQVTRDVLTTLACVNPGSSKLTCDQGYTLEEHCLTHPPGLLSLP